MASLVTLTTDFGTSSGYVAQMKGTFFQTLYKGTIDNTSRYDDCRLVDLAHDARAVVLGLDAVVRERAQDRLGVRRDLRDVVGPHVHLVPGLARELDGPALRRGRRHERVVPFPESKFVFEAQYLAQIAVIRADSLTGAHLDTRSRKSEQNLSPNRPSLGSS